MNARSKLLTCCASFISLSAVAADLRIEVSPHDDEVRILRGAEPVLLYVSKTNQFKPYVKELFAANSLNVLLDAPADHLHHHGLMYAVRVNGINFWEETGPAGREIPGPVLSQRTGRARGGLPYAAFTQRMDWVGPTNHTPLLTETRTITVTIQDDEVAVDWIGAFQVGATAVQVHGSSYNGLGLRVPPAFNRVAERMNPEGAPYTPAAAWDITGGRWSAVSGTADGRPAMVVIFSSPANAGESRFFSMLNPFTYSAATQNLDKQPLNYAAGARFTVRHLVTVYPVKKTADFLNQRYSRWANDISATPTKATP